ncbi:fibrinogen-related protein 3.2 [Elysia marginata]|uniref:Fibrinogen-related protein 3.2 n=1 Tax=Elysia marginata TaxID=1093978 RepID=A0AAV4FIM2_9GAST|nr:fibrinogen-related protein 3.2 [Elysia marginata]
MLSPGAGHSCGQLTCQADGNAVNIQKVILSRVKVTGSTDQLIRLNLTNPEQEYFTDTISGNGLLRYNRVSIRINLLEISSCESDMFTCEVGFRTLAGENQTVFSSTGAGQRSNLRSDQTTSVTDQKVEPALPVTCEPGMGNDSTETYPHYVTMTHSDINRQIVCDTQTDGGGWIVIQRRAVGDVDFYRNWTEYRDGFGDLDGDFWLGNNATCVLTNTVQSELPVADFIYKKEICYNVC